ncbi:MAG TPA: hypothetical protein VHN79_14245 [Lacunisphaera sp.]|nr:hypothetical protein [Lacunisphaera sp.]
MKTTALCFAFVASAAPFLVAGEVRPGASLAEVEATLGLPKGKVDVNGRQVLYYERGSIQLDDGVVTQVALLSPEEHAQVTAREERRREEQDARRAQLQAEGAALRDSKLADKAFQAAPASYQVAFWEDFARRYPGVSCVEPLSFARLRLAEQLDAKRQRDEAARRLDEIEARLAEAEREPVYYRVGYPVRHRRHHYHHEFGLGPITYTFYDAPLPVYTTPTTPLINPFIGDLAQPEPRRYPRSDRDQWKDHDRQERGWSGGDRGKHRRRDRM